MPLPTAIVTLSVISLAIILGSNSFFIPLAANIHTPPARVQERTNFSQDSSISSDNTTSTGSRTTLKTSFWYVGASSREETPNTGISSIIQVKSQNVTGVLSFWVSEALSNNFWAQVGYFINNSSEPIAFYQIWNLNNLTEIFTGTTAVTNGYHNFSMVLETGNLWQFALDSIPFGNFDLKANASNPDYPIYAMSEEGYVTSPFAFSEVLFSRAIQVVYQNAWHNATSATSFGDAWPIQGQQQSPKLAANEMLIGADPSQQVEGTFPRWD